MGNPEVDPSGPEVGFGEVWNMWNILASLWEGGAKGMITSFIIRYLSWQAHDRVGALGR
jgi:hypothetical protein